MLEYGFKNVMKSYQDNENRGMWEGVFIRTTKFVTCGREYFCGYGRGYYGRHGLS
jgi:hypothetical protein